MNISLSRGRSVRSAAKLLSHPAKTIIFTLLLASFTFAQPTPPPPLGPPLSAQQSPSFNVDAMVRIAEGAVQKVLDDTNTNFMQNKKDTRVSELPAKVSQLWRRQTQYIDRPNEWFYQLVFIAGIQVHIPNWFDRQVYLPININVSCEDWFLKGGGKLHIASQAQPASFEGGSWEEDAPGLSIIRDIVNNLVKNGFGGAGPTDTVWGTCTTLGAHMVPPPNDKYSAVVWDDPTSPGHVVLNPASLDWMGSLTVTFKTLKRLTLHINNAPLYAPTETIVLQTYANHTLSETQPLTMSENDSVALKLEPVNLGAPLPDPLVVLVNIIQQSENPEDSDFDKWPKSVNFSPGTHTLKISKRFTHPADAAHLKPFLAYLPGYELTYTVELKSGTTTTTTSTGVITH